MECAANIIKEKRIHILTGKDTRFHGDENEEKWKNVSDAISVTMFDLSAKVIYNKTCDTIFC